MNDLIIYYFLGINIFEFFLSLYDKRAAIKHRWRVSEKSLLGIAVCGGALGLYLSMRIFRHKTKHKAFTVGVPSILVIQITLLLYFVVIK